MFLCIFSVMVYLCKPAFEMLRKDKKKLTIHFTVYKKKLKCFFHVKMKLN